MFIYLDIIIIITIFLELIVLYFIIMIFYSFFGV